MADAAFFSQPHDHTQKVLADMASAEQALEDAFERWEYLGGSKKRRIKGEPVCVNTTTPLVTFSVRNVTCWWRCHRCSTGIEPLARAVAQH